MQKIKKSALVAFFKQQNRTTGFIDNLKINYRPYICPFSELLQQIPENTSLFDIGCGSGQFLLLVCAYRNPTSVMGIEISETLIENAKQLLQPYGNDTSIQLSVYDGDHLPENICEFKFVTLIDVGHHIPPKKQVDFFKTLFSKMGPGATLLYKDINGASPLVFANKLHDLVFSGEIGNELSQKKTLNIFESTGFKILSTSKKTMFWYPHFTIIAQKPTV